MIQQQKIIKNFSIIASENARKTERRKKQNGRKNRR